MLYNYTANLVGLVKAASNDMEKVAMKPETIAKALELMRNASPSRLFNPATGGLKISGTPVQQALASKTAPRASANLPMLSTLGELSSIPGMRAWGESNLTKKMLERVKEVQNADTANAIERYGNSPSFAKYVESLGL